MFNILSFLLPHLPASSQLSSSRDIVHSEARRKTVLMYGTNVVGIVFLCLLAILAYMQGNQWLATFDVLAALVLGATLILMKQKGCLDICIYTGIATIYCLYTYLLISGGISGTSFVWSYTFPLFVFFLLGTKKGFLVSLFYLLSCISIMVIDLNTSMINIYSKDLALRFIPSLMVVMLFALIFEKNRETTHQALLTAKDNLEDKVTERTQELMREIHNRKEKTKELQISESRYRALYDNSGDGISITSLDGQYRSAN